MPADGRDLQLRRHARVALHDGRARLRRRLRLGLPERQGPRPETCDGIDNDCNGNKDDGSLPQVGQPCGLTQGECKQGALACNAGVLDCVGVVGPTPELCNGKDDDCDGTIDNGIITGAPCDAPYDTAAYPGDRTALPCHKGVTQCDGMGGQICLGGVGPSPEICDGIDNDCDGKIDEIGAAPDGLDGSANPLPPPAANIGDACGSSMGECKPGSYHCVNGAFTCLGGQSAMPETCDCVDNNCDGAIDNPNGAGGPPLCGTNKECVKGSSGAASARSPAATASSSVPRAEVRAGRLQRDVAAAPRELLRDRPLGGVRRLHREDGEGRQRQGALRSCGHRPRQLHHASGLHLQGPERLRRALLRHHLPRGPGLRELRAQRRQVRGRQLLHEPCQGCGKACNLGACVANPAPTPSASRARSASPTRPSPTTSASRRAAR